MSLNSDIGEGGVAVNCEKTQFFLNTLYLIGTEWQILKSPSAYWDREILAKIGEEMSKSLGRAHVVQICQVHVGAPSKACEQIW